MIASVSLFTDWLKKILNQSEAKLKPLATRSGAFFCAAEHILFSLAHEIHLFLLGQCDLFDFCFETLDKNALETTTR